MTNEEIKRIVKERFDRSAASYGKGLIASRVHLRNHIKRISAIADILQVSEGNSVLEVGVGTGIHAEWICRNSGAELTGVDISRNMLKEAEKRLGSIKGVKKLLVADATALPFEPDSFDAAFSVGTIHYVPSPEKMVKEMARVIKPGGRIAIMAPNYLYPMVFLAYKFRKYYDHLPKIFERRLLEWAEKAGLTDIKVDRMLFTPPYPEGLSRVFDAIDRFVSKRNVLSRFSMNLLLIGRKA